MVPDFNVGKILVLTGKSEKVLVCSVFEFDVVIKCILLIILNKVLMKK